MASSAALALKVIESGAFGPPNLLAGVYLINNIVEWNNHFNRPLPDEIDFSVDSLIAASLGEKMKGGYSISISSIQLLQSTFPPKLDVKLTTVAPARSAFTISAITYPYTLVKISKIADEIQILSSGF
ncbi:hypothetical protein HK098_003063 [Nowakowskiella sp. JEL0407]|nr:hypothetical protein HK098_003063 [Nowakowskiella sp. JEL0407]